MIPGDLKYTWSRTYSPYSFNSTDKESADVVLNRTTDYTYILTRDFDNAAWYPQKSVA